MRDMDELRKKIAREIYATLHHLMRVTGTEAQAAYDRSSDNILALPEIAEALRFVEGSPGFERSGQR